MILVIGGAFAGKRDYVKNELGFSDEEMSASLMSDAPVLYDLQRIAALDPAGFDKLLPELIKKRVVICDEVGSGVVPDTPENRAYREAVGRLCKSLAREAESVIRICCGIPTVLK